jgi:hypothetical protein
MDRRSISCSASDRRCPPHRSDEHGLCFRRPSSKAYLLTRSNCFCIDDRLCGRKQCEAVQGSFSQSPSMTQTLPESIRLAFGSEDSSWGHEFGSRSVVETLNEFRPGSKGQRSWDREFPKAKPFSARRERLRLFGKRHPVALERVARRPSVRMPTTRPGVSLCAVLECINDFESSRIGLGSVQRFRTALWSER